MTSSIGAEGQAVERGQVGTLPPATELSVCLADWQQEYNQLGMPSRIKPQQIIYDGAINHRFRLTKLAKKLRQTLERWLNSPSFSPVDKHLREALNQEEVIRILICSDHPKIYQLPWCCWDLVASYPLLEIAYGSPNFAKVGVPSQPQHKVRILAILGDAQGIDIEGDRSFLRDITDAEVEFLVEPTLRKLNQCLWQKTWDIVFFAGHSKTQEGQGVLHLNAQERLTINQLSYGFKQAIASGLQLAIFNSCDGLGLAEELGRLSLPQSIVMRMPIPDQMAQEFMKYFLQAYANGNSLYLAMRRAREQLQGWERQFPCASWLPIIYQNPAVVPPNWSDLQTKTSFASHLTKSNILQLSLSRVILITALSIGLIWLVQSWGWLETAELNAYDRFRQLTSASAVSTIRHEINDVTYSGFGESG
ncbi:MAG: CHAT domain-containing protein, partial [Cyanobacteria bacterium J06558_2]